MSRICSNPEDCCRELSRVWDALGVTHYVIGQGSCSEQVARMKARAEQAEAEVARLRAALEILTDPCAHRMGSVAEMMMFANDALIPQ